MILLFFNHFILLNYTTPTVSFINHLQFNKLVFQLILPNIIIILLLQTYNICNLLGINVKYANFHMSYSCQFLFIRSKFKIIFFIRFINL